MNTDQTLPFGYQVPDWVPDPDGRIARENRRLWEWRQQRDREAAEERARAGLPELPPWVDGAPFPAPAPGQAEIGAAMIQAHVADARLATGDTHGAHTAALCSLAHGLAAIAEALSALAGK